MKDNGGPAFPVGPEHNYPADCSDGMTLRDYFAAAAISYATHSEWVIQKDSAIAKRAYILADAMLAEREKSDE